MKCFHLAFVLSAALLSSSGLAQSRNATLLSRFHPGSSYSDIWGYLAPNGKEYALLCESDGLYIVDCTNPRNPIQRGFFPDTASFARDVKVYRQYVYAVSETSGGTMIIDMSDPDSPQLVKTWGQALWSNAHNVAIDTQAGTLYPCGTNNGMLMIDLSQDPINPTQLGTYSSSYVHDLHIQDGIAHLCEVFNDRYRATDVTNLPSTTSLGTASIRYCHNAWATRDNRYVITTSETPGVGMTVLDLADIRLPIPVATWKTGPVGTIHNAYLRDRVAHMSYYGEGYRAVDISNPGNPREVAYYDTSSAWGAYPFMPSGTIYVSDINDGLYVIDTQAATALYGTGTPGGGSSAPSIHTHGASFAGNAAFALQAEGAAPGARGTLLLGVAPGQLTVAGLTLLVDIGRPVLSVPVLADGSGLVSVPIRLAAGLPRVKLYAQFLIQSAVGPLGLASSRGLEFEIFAR